MKNWHWWEMTHDLHLINNFLSSFLAMDENSQQQQQITERPMELVDVSEIASLNSPKELSIRLWENMTYPCPTIEDAVRLYPAVEILHLDLHDSWYELYPIAVHLSQLTELDLKYNRMTYNDIFKAAERIERMLWIACDRQLPIQRLKMDMGFGFIVNMLWMIADSLPQLKEVELVFQDEVDVGEIEDESCLRFGKLEKLSVECAKFSGELAAIRSIAMFTFDVLNELTLKGLCGPPTYAIQFIVRQVKLQKLKLIDCDGVNAEVLCEIKEKLPQLKEMVTDVDEQSIEVLKQRFGYSWVVSEQSETYDEKLKVTCRFIFREK